MRGSAFLVVDFVRGMGENECCLKTDYAKTIKTKHIIFVDRLHHRPKHSKRANTDLQRSRHACGAPKGVPGGGEYFEQEL